MIVRPCRVAAQAHSAVGRVTGREGVAEASVRVDRIHAAPRALGVGAARHLPRVKGGEIGGFEGEPADSSPWGSGGAPSGPLKPRVRSTTPFWAKAAGGGNPRVKWAPSSSGAFRQCCGTPQPASGSSERIESGREHREGCCEAQRLCRRGASACSIPWDGDGDAVWHGEAAWHGKGRRGLQEQQALAQHGRVGEHLGELPAQRAW